MINIRVSNDKMFGVIEPADIRHLKAGRPIKIVLPNGSMIALGFTPDANEFLRTMRIHPASGVWQHARVSTEELEAALKRCLTLPEVER